MNTHATRAAALIAAFLAITACRPHANPKTTATAITRPTTGPTTAPDTRLALAALPVRPEDTGAHYNRDDWGDWSTHSGKCTTRAIVLQRHGAGVTTGKACRITSGTWTSPYDNAVIRDPRGVDVDHRVTVKEALRSGARDWDTSQRARFYNDLDNLVPVSAKSNRSKGDRDPGKWRPSNQDEWCGYAAAYIATKTRYRLAVDQREQDALTAQINTCH